MKKILLYTDTPQVGGAELQIFLLAKFLNRKKFEPILACSNYPALDRWCKKFEDEKIPIVRMRVAHKHDPRHLMQLRKIIQNEAIELLHAHIWNPASCRYAFAVKSVPIITTEHDPFKLSSLKNAIKKHGLKRVKKIITVSKSNEKLVKELYPEETEKIHLIPNGIDIAWWQSQLLRFTDEERREIKTGLFHAHENTLIVITVAELHERKGQEFLLGAIPVVIEHFPNVKFVFAGEGPARRTLETLAEKLKIQRHVTFLGRQKDIPRLLKSSDVFCLPSRREAFGLVNLEAMITGLPVIATKVGGIPDIINDSETGILVEPENSTALADVLKKLIQDSTGREKMAAAGQKRALKFDAQNMAKEYEEIYQQVLSIHSP